MAGQGPFPQMNGLYGVMPPPPPFVLAYNPSLHRSRVPLPPTWVSVYGVILPIFCRMCLPNQAQWFVDLCLDGSVWCFGRGWDFFAIHAGFELGDLLMFAYQCDGLFIVSRLDVPPPFPFLDEHVVALEEVPRIEALPDFENLFNELEGVVAAIGL
ncbi:uncharacterized protein LOC125186629 [Salvia hispanica]|uniref:uncharacterized protein LOC125186629 n=1 Tax=Salvia hispanica TaxID=49212 RepID=UPI002009069B|nr:uncharacterized protein LOC125186629 [Salvia hispanica]